MPRTYKDKNVHTRPSKSGVKNMSKEFNDSHKDMEDDNLMANISDIFKIGVEKGKRTSAWTEEDLAREISAYFDYCVEKQLKPCKAGIRLFLGISKTQYYDWGVNPSKYGVISTLVQQANDAMELQYIGRSEKYPTANLFLLRTSHGHVETSKVDVTTNNANTTVEEVDDIISKLGLDKKKED